jgi:predicted ABC-type ATPase
VHARSDVPTPILHLIGGANGSGKTTFARAYLADRAEDVRFLNADEIARGLSPFAAEKVALKAGRLLLTELRQCLRSRESVALESTLSGCTYVGLVREARANGYRIELNYLWLPTAALAIRRVRQRVRKGGHSVPEADIRRRFVRSLKHLVNDYLPLADEWRIWDNDQSPAIVLAESSIHAIEDAATVLLRAR